LPSAKRIARSRRDARSPAARAAWRVSWTVALAVAAIVTMLLARTTTAAPPPPHARTALLAEAVGARRHHAPYCTRRHHRRGCIRVPRAAHRPRHVSEQGGGTLAPKGAVVGGGLGSGPGVRAATAVGWARSQLGSAVWAFRCELFVEEAFGTSSQFPTAWAAAQHARLHKGSVVHAPAGSVLYFAPDSVNDGFGHTGISLGHGRMVSALDTVQITDVATSHYWASDYIGWADAPGAWPGRIPPPPGGKTLPSSSAVAISAPAVHSVIGGTIALEAQAANVSGVAFFAYYAGNPAQASTIGWHFLGDASQSNGSWSLNWNTLQVPDQGNAAWGTVNLAAVAIGQDGQLTGTRDYREISVNNSQPPTTTTTTTTSTTTGPPPGATTHPETPGGDVHTWSDYTNAGGTAGPVIGAYNTVQIACKVAGFKVADGNTWWYRIASNPWNGTFYGSADAFYNNGQTTGSLQGTPFVDPNVPNC
jgi:hypothetical protein